ncbi:zinc-binding alcohol dehydrogenase family protein [Sporomusa sp.]|uniref:zinc-binding alcohol dehydrogenase family protein n=1 Tax=Sporomusa sp. TaxID=2078658 RepID=UPI002B9325DC|nr:zinc-binding alcohol dehydrogenase family protein [Sporomusa sp.]HWR45642.1 zinc-binding alcohol dehydrogenase family protein [Sporomusa sp.]
MKCICLEQPGKIGVKEIAEVSRQEGEALIQVESAGICGSDVGAFRGSNPLVTYPRVIGHEVVGTILEIGENETGLKAGDRVIVDPYIYCGQCYPCSIGRTNCCEKLRVIGVHIDGGMAERIVHPARMLHKVPDSIPLELAPMAEPLTIALHALHRTRTKAGEHVCIIGAGAIGLLMAQAALTYGAFPIVLDVVEERLAFARKLGVQHTILAGVEDAKKRIKEITGGRMAEIVVEASGANAAVRGAIDYVSHAGRIALTGWPKVETSMPTSLFTFKEVDIMGSRTSAGEFGEALALIANGQIDVRPIVSKVVKFAEVPDSVQELSEHPERYLKIITLF